MLDLTLKGSTGPVPMTVVKSLYFREAVGRLRDEGHDVRHFALLAQRSTMLRLLPERGLERAVDLIADQGAALRIESFAVSRLDLCLSASRSRSLPSRCGPITSQSRRSPTISPTRQGCR